MTSNAYAAIPTIPSSYLTNAFDDSQPKHYFSNIPPIPSILHKKGLASNSSLSRREQDQDSNLSISPLRLRFIKEKLIHEYGSDYQTESDNSKKIQHYSRELSQTGKQRVSNTQSPNLERVALLAKPKRISEIAQKRKSNRYQGERRSSIERRERY